MKFGIFYELQLPRPWEPDGELRLYQDALDQVELADRLGYDFAWEVEHHFLEEYSHSPAPEVFLGAASQRTRRIRLAHGIMQLTTSPPARVAERIAALDLVSRGRVEFGMAESASSTELEPLGRAFEEMMLDLPGEVVAEPVGEFDLVERVLIKPVLAARFPRARQLQLIKYAELHRLLLAPGR